MRPLVLTAEKTLYKEECEAELEHTGSLSSSRMLKLAFRNLSFLVLPETKVPDSLAKS